MALHVPFIIFPRSNETPRQRLERQLLMARAELQQAGNDLNCFTYLQETPNMLRQYNAAECTYAEIWELYRRIERELAKLKTN